MRINIINSASVLFAKNGLYGVSIDDICVEANTDKNTINNLFGCIENLYAEILTIGQVNFFKYNQLDNINQRNISAKSAIDELIEHFVFHIYEKDNWPTKVFARELLVPSDHFRKQNESLIFKKMDLGLEAIANYTGLRKDDPLLLATLFNCISPSLRLIALTYNDDCNPLKPIFFLPKDELCSYLKTFIFGGLDAIKSLALH